MTTNLGSDTIMDALLDTTQDVSSLPARKAALYSTILADYRKHFRPEFLNRIDDVIIFNPISQDILHHIVDLQIDNFIRFVKKEKDITLTVTPAAKQELESV